MWTCIDAAEPLPAGDDGACDVSCAAAEAACSIASARTARRIISALATGIKQIGGDSAVYIDGGQYVRLQSPDPRYGESLYYIDPQGVRYGLPDEETANTIGLIGPKTAPWQVVNLLVDGPVLSKPAALLEHDTLPADPSPRKIEHAGAQSASSGVGGG